MTKKQKITYYILLVLVSLLFLMAAVFKFMTSAQEVAGFAQVGLPVWFMYWIGIGEVLGTIGLWVKSARYYAAEGLFLVLAGAFGTTLVTMGFLLSLLPLVVAVLIIIILKLGNKEARTVSIPTI